MFFNSVKNKSITDNCQEAIKEATIERQNILDKAKNCLLTADEIERIKTLNYRIYNHHKDLAYYEWEKQNNDFLIALQNELLDLCNVDDNTTSTYHPSVSYVSDRANNTATFVLKGKSYVVDRDMLRSFARTYKYNYGLDNISTEY